MIKMLMELGIGAGVGALLGLLVSAWVQPNKWEGMALIILVCMIASTVMGKLLTLVVKRKAAGKKPEEKIVAVHHFLHTPDDERARTVRASEGRHRRRVHTVEDSEVVDEQ